jgi:hypothetical protein
MKLRIDLHLGLVVAGVLACQNGGGDDTGTAAGSTSGLTAPTTTVTPTTGETTGTTGETTGTTTNVGGTGSTGAEATSEPGTTTTTEPGTTTQGVETQGTTDGASSTTEMSASTGDSTEGGSSTGEPPPPSDIEVVITADNAYSFAYGTESDVAKFFGGVEATTAGEIFNCGEGPEKYVVPAADALNATYLYIIAWDDSSVTNGVLARFRRKGGGGGFGEDVFTGTKGWQACATGVQYNVGTGGPTLAVINEYINKCNAGMLDPNTTSGGWVDEVGTPIGAVAFGEDNTTPYDGGPKAGNEFPLVCPMDMPAEARWMWFNWDPANVKPPQSPFIFPGGGPNPYHQFLLFRFAAELVPDPQ